jgi:hypothetical protein
LPSTTFNQTGEFKLASNMCDGWAVRPAMALKPAGQDPERVDYAPQARTVTLCSQHKSTLFWIILLLVLTNDDQHAESCRQAHR